MFLIVVNFLRFMLNWIHSTFYLHTDPLRTGVFSSILAVHMRLSLVHGLPFLDIYLEGFSFYLIPINNLCRTPLSKGTALLIDNGVRNWPKGDRHHVLLSWVTKNGGIIAGSFRSYTVLHINLHPL